jgi:hypothetical protein
MAAGDLTVTVVGSYDTFALAVAAMDAGNDAVATDWHDLFIEPGEGPGRYKVLKYVRAAA